MDGKNREVEGKMLNDDDDDDGIMMVNLFHVGRRDIFLNSLNC
jgi:hypothetical protein